MPHPESNVAPGLCINIAKRNSSKRGRRTRGRQPRATREISIRAPALVRNRVPRPVGTRYNFRRSWVQLIYYNPATGLNGSGSANLQINFALSASNINLGGVGTFAPTCPSASEFSALFDQYKIIRVITRFDWSTNVVDPALIAYATPLLHAVVDHDDSLDAGVTDLLQYPGLVTHSFLTNGYTPLVLEHTPRPLRDVASTGVLTSYAPMEKNPFLRTTEMATPHYGVKAALGGMGASINAVIGYLSITTNIDVELINPK